MPYFELQCSNCRCFFELGAEKKVDIQNLFCVDCQSPDIKIISCDSEVSTRLSTVISAVQELVERVESVETMISQDFGPTEEDPIN